MEKVLGKTDTRLRLQRRGLYLGMTADHILQVLGKPLRPELMGEDTQGLIVKWFYDDVALVLRRRTRGQITCYRLTAIEEGRHA